MVHLVRFNQSSIDINLYYFTKTTDWEDWRATVEDHMLSFMKIIENSGTSMAFPTRSIYVEGLHDSTEVPEVIEQAANR